MNIDVLFKDVSFKNIFKLYLDLIVSLLIVECEIIVSRLIMVASFKLILLICKSLNMRDFLFLIYNCLILSCVCRSFPKVYESDLTTFSAFSLLVFLHSVGVNKFGSLMFKK